MRVRSIAMFCSLFALFGGSVLVAPAAAAEPWGVSGTAPPVTAVGHRMWQTNNTVYALAARGGVLYAGGSFTRVRPPGAAPGTQEVAQAYLAAFSTSTGQLISSWRPSVTGQVYALEVSPDGRRLYVGGAFGSINGSSAGRIAAFDITTPRAPALLSQSRFRASANAKVSTISASNSTVWFGGDFTRAGDAARTNVAAVRASDGALLPFTVRLAAPTRPRYERTWVSTVSNLGGRVALGGMFGNVNGVSRQSLAVVNATTGALDTGFVPPPITDTTFVTTTAVSGTTLYFAGRDDVGTQYRHEGVEAVDIATGASKWGANTHRCYGDTMDLLVFQGFLLVGTHAHDCHEVGTYPNVDPTFYAALLIAKKDTGQQLNFYPTTQGKASVPGSMNNTRALATDGQSVWVAGGWTAWNGVPQQNIVRLTAARPSVPPVAVAPTAAAVRNPKGVEVSWRASSDRDDRSLTYRVYRNGGTSPVKTLTAASSWWDRPTLRYRDTAVSTGQRVWYTVRVSDGDTVVGSSRTATVTAP